MKKLLIAGLLILILMLGACTGVTGSGGLTEDDAELTKTVESLEGNFSLDIPDSWVKDYSYTEEELIESNTVLCYTDNDTAFVSMVFFDNILYDYPLNTSLKYNLDYFKDYIIGEYEEMSLDGMDVFVFEYSMVDLSIDDSEFNYHGYFYMINTPKGVVEIDIYYVQEVFESKIVKPSEAELALLQEIAESFEVIEAE